MLGGMKFNRDRKQTTKPRPNPSPKTQKRDVRQGAKKQVINITSKKIKQSLNPYQRFMVSNRSASMEDLTKYFELRTSRFNARSIAAIAIGLSLFAVLITAYYQGTLQSTGNASMILDNAIPVVFIGAAIALIAFLLKSTLAMSDSNFDKNFDWYLEAKSHFKTGHQTQNMEDTELRPNPTQDEEVEAVEESNITEKSNNLEDSGELRRFLTQLEKASGSSDDEV